MATQEGPFTPSVSHIPARATSSNASQLRPARRARVAAPAGGGEEGEEGAALERGGAAGKGAQAAARRRRRGASGAAAGLAPTGSSVQGGIGPSVARGERG